MKKLAQCADRICWAWRPIVYLIMFGSAGISTSAQTTVTVGASGSTGQIVLTNGSGASVTMQNISASSPYSFNLPSGPGTTGYLLTSGGGTASMTWTPATFTAVSGNTTTGASVSGTVNTTTNLAAWDGSGNIKDSGVAAGSSYIPTNTVGQGGFWLNGLPSMWNPGTTSTATPGNSTMFAAQVKLTTADIVGHATLNVTSAGTGETLYVCLYNVAGTSLLWSANAPVNTVGVITMSAAQVTLNPGIYTVSWEQTGGSTAATITVIPTAAVDFQILNRNGTRYATAQNGISGSACPSSLGTLTALTSANFPAMLFEP